MSENPDASAAGASAPRWPLAVSTRQSINRSASMRAARGRRNGRVGQSCVDRAPSNWPGAPRQQASIRAQVMTATWRKSIA